MRTRAPTWIPLCMEPWEFADWAAQNRKVGPVARAPRPCSDCPAGSPFQVAAAEAGRCNGTPTGDQEEPDHDEHPVAAAPAAP